MEQYDYIIIGSGQAGTPLAFSLAKIGKVALIEKAKLGGTCLNVGCIPTKTYIASARRSWDAQHGEEFGIDIPKGSKTNMQKVKERKDTLINGKRANLEKGIADNKNITLYSGEAHFISNYEVQINGETITAKKIFINVGGRAFVPNEYKNVPHFTNEHILEIAIIPEHLIIIGGSYIGLEFGQMFRRFGSKVTIIERGSTVIAREDPAISDAVIEIFKEENIEIITHAKDLKTEKTETGIAITINGDEKNKLSGSHLLLAIGRLPNTDTLKLENTSILTNEKGFVQVNDYCQTNVEGIFAMGDCNGEGAFTHTSYNDFQIVDDFLTGEKKRKISDRIQTYGLFIDPPLGRVGMNRKEALQKEHEVLVANIPMSKVGRANEKGETFGFMEALIDAKTNKILGACVLGVGGDEIISGLTNLMYADQPYTIIRDSVQIHPTVSELIPTMLEKLTPLAYLTS